jgi:hypothetical protein
MLAAHGLTEASEMRLVNAGYSGSALSTLVRGDGQSFVLKRMSFNDDWIMHATEDRRCREVAIAARLPEVLPGSITSPNVGWARDGLGYALLMRDITRHLLPASAVPDDALRTIVERMAELHGTPPPRGVPWCPLERRLLLLAPAATHRGYVHRTMGHGLQNDLHEGWLAFDRLAPPRARELVHALAADVRSLVRALEMEPQCWLHGDLKFDNIGLDGDGRMWLIDWALALVAPAAVELGWFLAINSRRMTVTLDGVLDAYAAATRGAAREARDGLAAICGLLLRGWRKGLDAEAGEPEELRWWCERAVAASALL